MTIIFFFNKILVLGTVGAQVFIFLAVIWVLFFRKKQNVAVEFISKHGMFLAFLSALTATLASLFYSQVAGFAPCQLCWLQRIFMYPEVVLLGLALIKKDSGIIDYALLLAVIGFFISLYHNYVYYYNGGLNVFCQLAGVQVSCVKRYVFEFGYVTIPLMAATTFLLVIIFLLCYKWDTKKHNNVV